MTKRAAAESMKRVLIVDDEESVLAPLRDRLNKTHGDRLGVLTAGNGQEAIEILEQKTVDLLVTDLEMPVMDGFELLAWTSRKRPELGVIVMTSLGSAEREGRIAHDLLQCFEKPFEIDALENAILSGLDSSDKSYIRGVALATFLQLMHLEKKTCALKVSSGDNKGHLYLLNGQLIDAEYGSLKGEEAAYEIISWQSTEIKMDRTVRQDGPIKRPLELVLLDAFRIMDEKKQSAGVEPETLRAPPRPASEAVKAAAEPGTEDGNALSDQVRKQLFKFFNSYTAIREYALFDANGSLKKKNNGQCSFEGLDPTIYLHLTTPLKEKLGFGSLNYISFFMASRAHVLLFNLASCSLFVRLREGARPEVVAKEIRGAINNDLPQSSLR